MKSGSNSIILSKISSVNCLLQFAADASPGLIGTSVTRSTQMRPSTWNKSILSSRSNFASTSSLKARAYSTCLQQVEKAVCARKVVTPFKHITRLGTSLKFLVANYNFGSQVLTMARTLRSQFYPICMVKRHSMYALESQRLENSNTMSSCREKRAWMEAIHWIMPWLRSFSWASVNTVSCTQAIKWRRRSLWLHNSRFRV